MIDRVVTACIRGPSFCTKLGTNIIESINGCLAAAALKTTDFNLTHYPRAQMAIPERVIVGGHVAIANANREKLNLSSVSCRSTKHAADRERKGG